MTENHAPIACPACHSLLPFVEYGHKIGKNGKPAKWPIYEKCKNKECKIGRKTLGIPPEELVFESQPLKVTPPGPKYKLYQLTNRINPPLIFDDIWDALDGKPGTVNMAAEDITSILSICQSNKVISAKYKDQCLFLVKGDKQVEIQPITWPNTKGWGYFKIKEE